MTFSLGIVKSNFVVSRPSPWGWSLISVSHQDPLQGNGHWFLGCIKALCEAMVIDFFTSRPSPLEWSLILFIASRPSARQWSSISLHQAPLLWNGHWFSLSHRGPLRGNGHQFLYIKTLPLGMVINSFTSRPSAKQWSLISCLHRDHLQGNGQRFFYKETLSLGMVESTHKFKKKWWEKQKKIIFQSLLA